ncbi:hypothetical protein ACQP2Y_24210 [Actinoplanes sp. CA-051413]
MSRPWTCRLGWHKWTRHSTEDGQPFLPCSRCDKPPSAGLG